MISKKKIISRKKPILSYFSINKIGFLCTFFFRCMIAVYVVRINTEPVPTNASDIKKYYLNRVIGPIHGSSIHMLFLLLSCPNDTAAHNTPSATYSAKNDAAQKTITITKNTIRNILSYAVCVCV